MTDHAAVEIVRHFDPVMLPPGTTVMVAARHIRGEIATGYLRGML